MVESVPFFIRPGASKKNPEPVKTDWLRNTGINNIHSEKSRGFYTGQG